MGKYMRKSKSRGEISLLEVSHHHTQSSSPLGVRTRAKTLALQRLQQNSNSTAGGGGGDGGGGGSYLQLRSRRLEKPPHVVLEGKRRKHPYRDPNLPNPGTTSSRKNSGSVRKVLEEVKECLVEEKKEGTNQKENSSCEASFGENLMEFEGRERTTRESTPCSLIRDPDNIQTPGSTTRRAIANEANGSVPNSTQRHIPTAPEMNDFFAGAEEQQQKQFIEKYNFDPVNEKPLPGRYEWVKVDR